MKKNQFLFNLCNYFPHFPPFTASPLNSPYLLYFPIIPNVLYFSYFCKFSVFPNIIISPLYHIFPIILVLLIFSMFFILYTFPIFHTNLIFSICPISLIFHVFPPYLMIPIHDIHLFPYISICDHSRPSQFLFSPNLSIFPNTPISPLFLNLPISLFFPYMPFCQGQFQSAV